LSKPLKKIQFSSLVFNFLIILSYLKIYKFDGVDIDWQYPNTTIGRSNDKKNFVALVKVNFDFF
jgi:GH18 family chitinase